MSQPNIYEELSNLKSRIELVEKFLGLHGTNDLDTVIVPARHEGFQDTFIERDCWFPLNIHEKWISQMKFIAAYRQSPVSAVTHFAPIDRFTPTEPSELTERQKQSGRIYYTVLFARKAIPIGPIPRGNPPRGYLQDRVYTTSAKLFSAKTLEDIR